MEINEDKNKGQFLRFWVCVWPFFFEFNNINGVKPKNTCYNIKAKQFKSHLISFKKSKKRRKTYPSTLKEYNKLLKKQRRLENSVVY